MNQRFCVVGLLDRNGEELQYEGYQRQRVEFVPVPKGAGFQPVGDVMFPEAPDDITVDGFMVIWPDKTVTRYAFDNRLIPWESRFQSRFAILPRQMQFLLHGLAEWQEYVKDHPEAAATPEERAVRHVSLIVAVSTGPLETPLVRGRDLTLFGNSVQVEVVTGIPEAVRALLKDADGYADQIPEKVNET